MGPDARRLFHRPPRLAQEALDLLDARVVTADPFEEALDVFLHILRLDPFGGEVIDVRLVPFRLFRLVVHLLRHVEPEVAGLPEDRLRCQWEERELALLPLAGLPQKIPVEDDFIPRRGEVHFIEPRALAVGVDDQLLDDRQIRQVLHALPEEVIAAVQADAHRLQAVGRLVEDPAQGAERPYREEVLVDEMSEPVVRVEHALARRVIDPMLAEFRREEATVQLDYVRAVLDHAQVEDGFFGAAPRRRLPRNAALLRRPLSLVVLLAIHIRTRRGPPSTRPRRPSADSGARPSRRPDRARPGRRRRRHP